MERVKTLIKKLQQQVESEAPVSSLLNTARMLQSELLKLSSTRKTPSYERVTVVMPHPAMFNHHEILPDIPAEEDHQPIDQIQNNATISGNGLPETERTASEIFNSEIADNLINGFDPIEDIPTLAHQDQNVKSGDLNIGKIDYPEVKISHEELNDKLNEKRPELSDRLTDTPIKDLRKAIGVNDRYLFINELFRGDESMYSRSIKTIQNFSIFPEAEYWIRRELKVKLGWNATNPLVKQFDNLVKRRFQ